MTKIPSPFPLTDKHREWARENRIPGNLEGITEQFHDHFKGKGETRADWEATWRTWMRNERDWKRGGKSNGRQPDRQEANIETAHGILSELYRADSGSGERNVTPVDSGSLFESPGPAKR